MTSFFRQQHFQLVVAASTLWAVGCGKNPTDVPQAESITKQESSPQAKVLQTASLGNEATSQESVAVSGDSPASSAMKVAEASRDPVKERQANELVATLLRPGTEPENWDAAHAELLTLGTSAVHVLMGKLSSGTDEERELAATALALVGEDASIATDTLRTALKDRSPFVRANAAAALLQWPDHSAEAIPALIHLLNESDPQIRQLSAMNLSALGEEAGPYVADLQRTLTMTNPPEVVTPVVELLGRIGPSAEPAIPVLQKIAFESEGDVATAAQQAIQLIKATGPDDNKTP
ncbi:HEAT repeat domain-containing protein [Planctomicrobium sp. SH527]|uniref:HEAT repeat domain-containing protein n=1 Tax=Planctomicrobium sp. SH527 TaxID=3448123 RepID=UPI003F5C4FE0